MRLTISVVFDNDQDEEMLDFTVSADFKDMTESSVTLATYLQNNPKTISFVEEAIGAKFDTSFDDPEEIFITVIEGPVGHPDDAPDLLLQTIDSFIYNLENKGFKCLSKTSMVTETFPENIENNTPKEFLN